MYQLYLLLQWHERNELAIKTEMRTSWPDYFGHHEPWKNCNKKGSVGKNARKRIWMRIRKLQEEGFNDQGKRKRKMTNESTEHVTKRRRSSALSSKRSYWKKRVEQIIPEEERVELALSILEDYFPGARLWFTKAIPNMKEVTSEILSDVKIHFFKKLLNRDFCHTNFHTMFLLQKNICFVLRSSRR